MELLQLRYFLTVARMLNISQAAKHHMIPQPAMSKTISRLEQELGVKLFDRYKNRLSLTNEGETFYRSVSMSLNELDSATQQLNDNDAPLGGELKILVQQHRATMADCIMAFKKLYPQVSFRISYELEDTPFRDFDLCISCTRPSEDFNSSECLITEPIKLVLSADHPKANQDCITFAELRNEEFIMLSPTSSLWQQTVVQCREVGFEPKNSINCLDLHCLMKYISAGMAVTLGPEIAWQGLRNEQVVFLSTKPALHRSTYVFWNDQRSPSRLSQSFRKFMIDFFNAIQ